MPVTVAVDSKGRNRYTSPSGGRRSVPDWRWKPDKHVSSHTAKPDMRL
ncbi:MULTISPECIES: hypothetical protein [Pseudomonas syringae group]